MAIKEQRNSDSRAVVYARVSGNDRRKDDRNLDGQLKMCKEYVLSHHYILIDEVSEDDRGASGAAFELPGLSRVLEMARASKFDVLVVREIDRLSRNLAKQLIVEAELKRAGVRIEYVLGEYPDTPEGNLMKHVRASVAEFERLKISERMVRGRYLKVKAGSVLVAKHPPYGYDVVLSADEKKYLLIPNPDQSQIVQMTFTWFTAGTGDGKRLGIEQIGRRLDELGVPPPRAPIRERHFQGWSHTAITKILSNRTYVGTWTYGKTRRGYPNPSDNFVSVSVPRIVDDSVWEEAQQRLRRNREMVQRNVKQEYLMGRRLRCGSCDRLLYVEAQAYTSRKTKKTYKYYACKDYITRSTKCKGMRSSAGRADEVVWEWVKSLMLDARRLKEGLAAFQKEKAHEVEDVRKHLEVVDGLLVQNREQLDRLIDLYLSNAFDKDVLIDRRARLEETISSLKKERERIVEQLEARTLTSDQMQTILEFGEAVRSRLPFADANFQARRELIEVLDVTGRLVREQEGLIIYAQCIIGGDTLRVKETATCAR